MTEHEQGEWTSEESREGMPMSSDEASPASDDTPRHRAAMTAVVDDPRAPESTDADTAEFPTAEAEPVHEAASTPPMAHDSTTSSLPTEDPATRSAPVHGPAARSGSDLAAADLPEHPAATTDTADPEASPERTTLAVVAHGLRLHGSRGPVYGPVDLELATGALTLVQGPQGAGRSSLLLTIAGRMTPDRGSELTVLGEPLPRRRTAVQRRSAVAGFAGIDDLDDSVTVGDLTRERLRWLSPWYRRAGRVSQQQFAELAGPVFGPRPLPRVDSVVWDLDEVDRMLLRITLAMAQDPELLVVDDVDQVHDTERRRTVWSRLEALAADGLTVIAAIASLDEAARVPWSTPPELVTLATGPHAIPA